MKTEWKRRIFPCCIFVATCFGVFVLPFFFPPPYLKGISIANVAGFNNKVAAVAAAVLSVFVFLFSFRRPLKKSQQPLGDYGRLSNRDVWIPAVIFGGVLTLLSWLVIRSHMRYLKDAGYFIEQISLHTDYGRKLYAQIDFPYGPLLFYGTIFVRGILSPFHVSLTGAYYTTLVIEHIAGLLLVAYVIDSLRMLRKWRILLYVLCAVGTLQLNLGLNYTFFRFLVAPAFLVLAARRRKPWGVAACFFAGEAINLALSPEIAFAFGAASVAYGAYFCYTEGRAWLIAAAAPFVAAVGFLLLIDRSYLLMLRLFAKGINNFVVEPLPHVLVFLFALVWLVPCLLARGFRERRPDAPGLTALYVFSLALLPVAFGSADPGHVFFNGLMIFFLSMVAISSYRPRQQIVWALCIAGVFLWPTYLNIRLWYFEWRPALTYGVFHYQPDGLKHAAMVFARTGSWATAERGLAKDYGDRSFDIEKLDAIVGSAPVATPLEVPLYVEDQLKRSGQYTPTYYCSLFVYDAAGEDRVIRELNSSQWALLPKGAHPHFWEGPGETRFALGIQLTYPAKHKPYVIGSRFMQNLADQWQPYGEVGAYQVYRRR